MLKSIASVFLVTSLTGCSSLGDVFISGSNAAYVMDQNGQSVSNLILKADLSANELATVQDAQTTIVSLREGFRDVQPANLLTLHIDYLKAKTAYESVYDVVVAHKSEYTDDEWQLFKDAHATALDLDAAVNEYILDSDKANSANTALKYLNAAAKLAAVL